jgi:hypothetical protein
LANWLKDEKTKRRKKGKTFWYKERQNVIERVGGFELQSFEKIDFK